MTHTPDEIISREEDVARELAAAIADSVQGEEFLGYLRDLAARVGPVLVERALPLVAELLAQSLAPRRR